MILLEVNVKLMTLPSLAFIIYNLYLSPGCYTSLFIFSGEVFVSNSNVNVGGTKEPRVR